MTERQLIAELAIYAIDKDSRGFDLRLMIGKPYPTDSPLGDWACPMAMVGLWNVYPDIYGSDSWQALMMARSFMHNVLAGFVEDGGRLFREKDGKKR